MKKRNGQFNPKRKILKLEKCDFNQLLQLSFQAQYGGNPMQEKDPFCEEVIKQWRIRSELAKS